MTAAQIQARVDAWLAARSEWLDSCHRRRTLSEQWRHASTIFGADSASAKGVLLGLVREAHGDETVHVVKGSRGQIVMFNGHRCLYGHVSEAEALAMALEAAP